MKPNKLTPGYNLVWESSRMMLPEHKEKLKQHQKELEKRKKPLIDEQQLDIFSQILSDAMVNGINVKIEVFGPYTDRYVSGNVLKFDSQRRQIKMRSKGQCVWIKLEDIVDVQVG